MNWSIAMFDLPCSPTQCLHQLRVSQVGDSTLRFEEIIDGSWRIADVTLPIDLILGCLPPLEVVVKAAAASIVAAGKADA
jgi:hypothetical protein